ncbi:tripartite tricarboxylate transporter TctB family protein [Luteipulveratus mongoliensis]|uniref:Membrane protein n=1 Tax=Luteipulveratus mongoliensis TaxID=571913 RepID=A0A0K1JNG7_9MICO|nr:tripartite tricarboxylate transporter TctB family protein [Luteipulveratus mongoliensis]AKU18135.1 membrane protein [Luteipulveratus mongoliensis]
MSTPTDIQDTAPERERDLSQLILVGILAGLGILVAVNASRLRNDFAKLDPVGPRAFPYAVAIGLLILSVLLAIAVLRGSLPESEEGEDIDLTQRPDWLTVGKLVAVFLFLIATVNVLGWAISGALFFAGCSLTLGSRTWLRDLAIGTVLSVGSFYAFYSGLGVPLPAGILDGIL